MEVMEVYYPVCLTVFRQQFPLKICLWEQNHMDKYLQTKPEVHLGAHKKANN